MKKFFVIPLVVLLVTVSLLGLSGAARAVPTVTTPQFGLGNGDCFYDGSFGAYTAKNNNTSCVGMLPPPESSCNPNGIQNSTLDVLHEVRDKIDIGGYATFYIFQSDAGGCGSGWSAAHIDSGCHVVSSISISNDTNGHIQGGIDPNGKLICAPGWESSRMVDAESGSTLTAKVILDFQAQQSASVAV